jgi:hypothetical protein
MHHQSQRRRDLIIIMSSAVLLIALGVSYFIVRRQILNSQFTREAQGTVVGVAGNTITVRDFGRDNKISSDDFVKTYVISSSSLIKTRTNAGDLVTVSQFKFEVGNVVIVQQAVIDSNGLWNASAIDVLYSPIHKD